MKYSVENMQLDQSLNSYCKSYVLS